MDQYIVLPSGRVLQTDDIIYVGVPKENKGLFVNYAAHMNVIWACPCENSKTTTRCWFSLINNNLLVF